MTYIALVLSHNLSVVDIFNHPKKRRLHGGIYYIYIIIYVWFYGCSKLTSSIAQQFKYYIFNGKGTMMTWSPCQTNQDMMRGFPCVLRKYSNIHDLITYVDVNYVRINVATFVLISV